MAKKITKCKFYISIGTFLFRKYPYNPLKNMIFIIRGASKSHECLSCLSCQKNTGNPPHIAEKNKGDDKSKVGGGVFTDEKNTSF